MKNYVFSRARKQTVRRSFSRLRRWRPREGHRVPKTPKITQFSKNENDEIFFQTFCFNEKIEINRILWLNAKRPKNMPIQYHKKEQKKEMNVATIDIEEQLEKSDKIIQTSTTVNKKISTAKNIHTVVEGESLWSIAQKYNVSVKDLRTFNEINESGTVNIGQQLYIFSTQKELSKSSKSNIYTVQAGDSFYSIAVKHNMTVKDLMRLNRRINDVVMIGDKLKVYSN